MNDFQKLWLGQAISVFGSLITRTALPWCALLFLRAGALDMALLVLGDLLPGFLIGLLAGAWVDRSAKRPLMIVCDLLRLVVVAAIPLLALTGHLRLWHLYAIAPVMGALSTLFDIAYQTYLPELVDAETLGKANSRLSASASVAELCAFGISGWLIHWLGGPGALWIDAATFLVSALSLAAIRTATVSLAPREASDEDGGLGLFHEALEGLRYVRGQVTLRTLALGQFGLSLGGSLMGPLYLLFVTRDLKLEPGYLGMIFGIGGATSLLGAALAEPLARRWGIGRAAVLGFALIPLGALTTPLAPVGSGLAYLLLIANQCLTDPGWTIFEVHQTTLRQTLAPAALLGRVNAVTKVGGLGASLVGTLVAGIAGDRFGARAVLFAGCGMMALAALWLALSPLRHVSAYESHAPD